MLCKNEETIIKITDVTQEGSGVGRAGETAVFVPGTAAGDVIRAKIVKVRPRFCYGISKEILTASPDRCEPDCAAFPRCGGCTLRHISYEAELRLKAGWVRETMRRVGGVAEEPEEILPSPQTEGYRNKAIYPIAMQDGRLRIGFYAKRSHRIEEGDGCRLHPPFFSEIVRAVRGWIEQNGVSVYDETTHQGLVRALFLRYGEKTGQTMACIIANGTRLPAERELIGCLRRVRPELCSVVLNVNRERTNVLLGRECRTLFGADTIEDELCGLRFSLSPLSFYQVNRAGAERLYQLAAQFADLKKGETLLDLYCGAGTIGLTMAKDAGSLIGVEIVPQAIENARQNAEKNGVSNARFLCGDAADAAQRLEEEKISPDVVIVDPPRKGLTPGLIATIARMVPSRVVYVSCNPATAARDAAVFLQYGYRTIRIRPVDLFPRTGHVETVLLLCREG